MSSDSGAAKEAVGAPLSSTISATETSTSAPPGGGASAGRNSAPLRAGTAAKRILEAEDVEPRPEPRSYSLLGRLRRYGVLALHYLFQTEVHTYAFSVAANSVLSFFPFNVLLMTVTRRVLHSTDMYNVVVALARNYLPSNQDFVLRNLQFLASVKGKAQLFSFAMLFIACSGIFLPLEVALNSVWGFKKNRSYVMNAIVSLALVLCCVCLMLVVAGGAAEVIRYLTRLMGNDTLPFRGAHFMVVKASAVATGVGIYFLIYWALPNGRVPIRAVLPAAIIIAVLTEVAKSLYILSLHWLNFQDVYGPFAISVTLMFWTYINGMLLLVGAFLTAARYSDRMEARQSSGG